MSVYLGQPVNISCKVTKSKQDKNITILWRVDNNEYGCAETEISLDIACFLYDNHSVLQIENTSSLGLGVHPVQCVLQQDIPQRFQDDPSFFSVDGENITRDATLTVIDGFSPVLLWVNGIDSMNYSATCNDISIF